MRCRLVAIQKLRCRALVILRERAESLNAVFLFAVVVVVSFKGRGKEENDNDNLNTPPFGHPVGLRPIPKGE
jgi:hypothetical protein